MSESRHPQQGLMRPTAAGVPGPVAARPVEPPPDDGLHVRHVAWVLWRRKWQVLLVAVLVVGPAMIATALAERLYRSSTLVQVSPESPRVLPYQDMVVTASAGNYLFYVTTQEQVLRGPALLARVAAVLAADPDPEVAVEATRLAGRREIALVPNSEAFRISYLSPRPDVAARVANLFAEEYIRSRYEAAQDTRQKARELLERELAALETKVQSSEKELVAYAQQHNIYQTDPARGDLAQEKLANLAQQVIVADAEVVAAESRAKALEAASVGEFPEDLVSEVIRGRVGALLQLEHELTVLRTSFGENWPAVVQKRDEIALVTEQLRQEKAAALAQAREQARFNLQLATETRTRLAGARADQEKVVVGLQNSSIQYNIIRREVETNQKLYEGLLERLKEAGIGSGMEFGNVHVLEPATPADVPATPRPGWNFLLSAVAGLTLGLCSVVLREFWQNTMSTIADVEHVTVLPVLASVPLVKPARKGLSGRRIGRLLPARAAARPAPRLAGSGPAAAPVEGGSRQGIGQRAEVAEAVRAVCASLLLSRSDRPPRTVAVTSAAPGEGKTTMVTQLGRALAETGARTLLVECDLRRPAFREEFGIGAEGGLSLFLSGHVASPTVHATDLDTLFVVGAGPAAPNPVALLNSDRLGRFLDEMTADFAFVLIDTPPAVAIADARVVGAKVDGVLLVVRAGQTSRDLLRRACAVLETSGAHLLGAVLNGSESAETSQGYYYGYASTGEATT